MALTAQEVLDKFGYIPFSSGQREPRGVCEATITTVLTPAGMKVVLIAESTEEEHLAICRACGITPLHLPYRYKAVAE